MRKKTSVKKLAEKTEETSNESVKSAIPRAEFRRQINEILDEMQFSGIDFEKKAVEALQESAEDFMRKFFESARISAGNAGRRVVKLEDLKAVKVHLEIIDKNSQKPGL